jgi:hypothetical protein
MRSFALVLAAAVLFTGIPPAPAASAPLSEPIDDGFVFFDGRYVEAPYIVETQDLAVTINGFQVTREFAWPPLQKYRFDHDPGLPEGLTRNSTLDEALGVREPGGVLFDTAKQWFLFSHLAYDEAYEQMLAYYRSLPCVRSLERNAEGFWILESHSGERRRLAIGGRSMRLLSEYYAPSGSGPPPRREYEELVAQMAERFAQRLRKGDCLLLYPGGDEISFAERRAAVLLPEILATISSGRSDEAKLEELWALGAFPRGDQTLATALLHNYSSSRQLEERLARLRMSIRERYGEEALAPPKRDADLEARKAKETLLNLGPEALRSRGVAYTPDGKSVRGYCAYTYDPAFTGFDAEFAAVGDHVKDQDFNSTLTVYKDTGGQDSSPGSATYDHFKDMAYADLLYLACHGWEAADGGYIEMICLQNEAQVRAWCGHDTTVVRPVEITTENWPTGHPWAACGTSAWPTARWKTFLDQSKAISILSCCYSHENGWTAACGGGVAFGYNISTTGTACVNNNRELLRRMNGTIGDGAHRKAYLAYNAMPAHELQFRITPANAEITLAPATETHEPAADAFVDAKGTGYFQVDTYCDASVAATEALTFNTDGDVTISNVHWVGTNRVNRIEFDWEGTGEFEVTVTAHADKFHSWGAATASYHRLDGDKKAPTGDDYQYKFKSRPRSIVFVIDDTGSMGNEIASVRATLLSMIDTFEAESERVLYTLITYKDDVTLRGQTEDPAVIRGWVSGLGATGGGDCPEEGCGALTLAANVAPDSEAWWMTDADVHGGWAALALVRARLWWAGVRLHSVIMGSCTIDAYGRPRCEAATVPEGQQDASPHFSVQEQVNSYEAASYLSEGTGGLYFPVSSADVPAATAIILEEMTRSAVSTVYNDDEARTYVAPVDASVTTARFLVNPLTSISPVVTIRNPSGGAISTSSPGVSLMTAGDTYYYIVGPPTLTSGEWTAEVSNIADHLFRCSVESPATFDYLGSTSGTAGLPFEVQVELDGPYPTPSFMMVNEDGSSTTPLTLYDDGLHNDGNPADGRYAGTFTPPSGTVLRSRVTGDGDFCRMDPAKIFFTEMSVTASGNRYVVPTDSVDHVLMVQNLSATSQQYDLDFTTSLGWADIAGLPASVTLEPDSSYTAFVRVRVPAAAFNGQEDVLTLSAAQTSDPLVSGSASVTTIAWSGPHILSVTPTTAELGTQVTIGGSFFGADPGAGNRCTLDENVALGSVLVPDDHVLSWATDTIVIQVPEGVRGGLNATVVTAGGVGSNGLNIMLTVPTITEITPARAWIDDELKIAGYFFGTDPGAGNHATATNNVVIGASQVPEANFVSWGEDTIRITVPPSAVEGSNSIYVTAGGVQSNTYDITLSPPPPTSNISWGLRNDNVFFFPNPCDFASGQGQIWYGLNTPGNVTIQIYDARSSLVRTLASGEARSERTQIYQPWDGRNDNGEEVANGVYFYVIESSGGEKAVGKIAVLR